MTWTVVLGSTLVMMAWIVIYSFFPSQDFVDEVSILFGTVSFWATILVTVCICLGMFLNTRSMFFNSFHFQLLVSL